MKERPILFSGPMIRALLDGTKTQTRRIVKPQPRPLNEAKADEYYELTLKGEHIRSSARNGFPKFKEFCPYGQPGDRLWVKETWRPFETLDPWDLEIIYAADGAERYISDGEFGDLDWIMPKAAARGNVSPLFMPRWASRITLEITGVRVERLQDISEGDAIAEGCRQPECGPDWLLTKRWAYRSLWESLNGPGSWDANPWVWVVEFRRIEQDRLAA